MEKHIYKALNLVEDNIVLERVSDRLLATAIDLDLNKLAQGKQSPAAVHEVTQSSHTAVSSGTVQHEEISDVLKSSATSRSTGTVAGLPLCDKICVPGDPSLSVRSMCSPVCDSVFSDVSNPVAVSSSTTAIISRLRDMFHNCDSVCGCVCGPVCDKVCDSVCDSVF